MIACILIVKNWEKVEIVDYLNFWIKQNVNVYGQFYDIICDLMLKWYCGNWKITLFIDVNPDQDSVCLEWLKWNESKALGMQTSKHNFLDKVLVQT